MADKFKAFWLGIFILAALFIMGWFILFLRPHVGDGETTLRVRFSNVEGIYEGTQVTFAGKPVGAVKEITEVPNPRSQPTDTLDNLYIYELLLKVDSSVHVYNYDEIIFATSGLLGEKSITIIPKGAPPSSPPAHNVTDEILYGRSTDQLEQTLNQLVGVAGTFEETLEDVSNLVNNNNKELNTALTTFSQAAESAHTLFDRANASDLAGRASTAFESLETASSQASTIFDHMIDQRLIERLAQVTTAISEGEGTLGHLIHDDTLYIQLTASMGRLETLLDDINNYGLLFQYDKGWLRCRARRRRAQACNCDPCAFLTTFSSEVCSLSDSLSDLRSTIDTLPQDEVALNDPTFASRYRQLKERLDRLDTSLQLYSETLTRHSLNAPCPSR